MTSWSLALSLLVVLQAKPETAADAVTLRDGTVVLGQVVEPSPRGKVMAYVRRAWAEGEIPERVKRWDEAEKSGLRRAARLRRERLDAWRRERVKDQDQDKQQGGEDRIARWLDEEIARLDHADPPPAELMVVTLDRGEVKSMARRPKASARMLRQGWLSGFRDVETMPLNDLKSALEDRGFAVGGTEPVALDRMLPILAETEEIWLTRRAATEVLNDSGVRFIQVQDVLLPEPLAGQPLNMAGALAMVSGLSPLLEGKPADPLATQLRTVSDRGRVGAVVTRQEMSPALDSVRITLVLWVRNGARWSPAGSRTASVRTDALKPGDGDDLAQDPQVGAVFRVFESIGFGFSPEVKQASLNIGAATRKALGMARAAFNDRLAALALPLEGNANARP
jgi:hypothetical protein